MKAFRKKRALWAKLLAPHHESAPGAWRVGSGPDVEIVERERDGICSMTWEVKDLKRAQNVLDELGIGSERIGRKIAIDPADFMGLNIALVERSEGGVRGP